MKTYTKRDLDLARLASVLDCEGCLTIRWHEGNKLSISLSVQMTSDEYCLLFKSYFGGQFHKKKQITKGGLPVFRYHASREVAKEVIKSLYPYLLIKKSRAELALKIHSIKLSHGGHDKRISEKWKLAKELVSMNSKKGGQISKVLQFPIPNA